MNPGERSNASWFTKESVDRTQEVVIAKGMNDSQFAFNPLVALQHADTLPLIRRFFWSKPEKDGNPI